MADLAAKSKTAVAYDSFVPPKGKEDNFLEKVHFKLGYTVRTIDDYDVKAIMYDLWEDNSATVAHTIKTFWMYCPQSFLVCVNEEGTYCGIISAVVFEDEIAFCGFNHVKPGTTEGIRRMLWDAVLAINAGRNVFTLVPAERVNSYHRHLGFHTSSRGLVLHGKLPETTDISHFGKTDTVGTK
ncbi:uncharacterized protein LOC121834621, partial [Ixodes scapularis]|uniref:uncharacterized protein LOC121834621 n=1 Tax=Ixodes scapularis TaxID=6945 RepID=UPI001C391043